MQKLWKWITQSVLILNLLFTILLAAVSIIVTLWINPGLGENTRSLVWLIAVAIVGSFVFVAAVRQAIERRNPQQDAKEILVEPPSSTRSAVSGHLAQLPPTPSDFVGRNSELADLSKAVAQDGSKIVGIFGMGGIGKTTLARRFIEMESQRYSEGQIELDMMGLGENPLTLKAAMEEVLRAHNPSMTNPASAHQLEAMYFSTLKQHNEIIFLDNVLDETQVEELIPPSNCLLVVTSRQHFVLPGMHRINLKSLPPGDAETLILAIAPRIEGFEAEIAKTCAFHPLAIRLAASALAVDTSLSPQDYIHRLIENQERLALVEASLDLSYRMLNAELQSRWRSLAAFPGSFNRSAAQSVMALDVNSGQQALSSFLNLSLIEYNSATERYRLHDLFREFADSRLTGGGRTIALLRHAQHFLEFAGKAADEFSQGGDIALTALDRIDLDWHNITSARRSINSLIDDHSELAPMCAQFCASFIDIIEIRVPPKTGIEWFKQSLDCAERQGDWQAIRGNKIFLGNALIDDDQYEEGIRVHKEALELARVNDDRTAIAMSLSGIGNGYMLMGTLDAARYYQENALALSQVTGDRRGEGHAYRNLGTTLMEAEDLEGAEKALRNGLTIAKEFDDPVGIAVSLNNLGLVLLSQGKTDDAAEMFEEALAIKRQLGDLDGQITTLMNLAQIIGAGGDDEKGFEMLSEAKEIARSIDSPKLKTLEEIEREARQD